MGILIKKHFKKISENQYLRERYPQLLCFYFNHPTELIYILTSTNKLTDKESNLLDKICGLLLKEESDNTIINTALQTLSSLWNLHFEAKSESIPHSQQLAFLDKSIENLNRQKLENNTAITAINKYKEKIESLIQDNEKVKKLREGYNAKLATKPISLKENESIKNSFEAYLNLCELAKKQTHNSLLNLGLKYDIYTFLRNDSNNFKVKLNSLIKTNDFIFNKKGITFNNIRNNYLIELYNSLNIGEMGTLITECIAFFYGKYIVRANSLEEIKIFSRNKYDLPFSIGIMCQKSLKINYKKFCSLIKDIFCNKKYSVRQFFWLYLLDEKYRQIIKKELKQYLAPISDSLKNNSEYKRKCEFICSLFNIHNSISKENNFRNDAAKALLSLEKNPQKTITRTEQLLFPIFLFLSNLKDEQSTDKYNKLGSQLNNSRFVLEFIRAFGNSSSDLNELFKPIHGFSDIERHIFETMAIIRLDIEEPDHYLLKKYIFNNISDFANLNFALNILGFK